MSLEKPTPMQKDLADARKLTDAELEATIKNTKKILTEGPALMRREGAEKSEIQMQTGPWAYTYETLLDEEARRDALRDSPQN
ncbi:hypothetical protein K8R03_00285 [Candidatus Kaiserbacteria bacterium]|nr:hypothetical protein [Candidatus Kaiserbacteria bacterium]